MNIVPLTIVSSTILSVRLRAEMLPIDIIVKRPIIEDYFRLSSSSPQRRQASCKQIYEFSKKLLALDTKTRTILTFSMRCVCRWSSERKI
jgi:hypothetical protein